MGTAGHGSGDEDSRRGEQGHGDRGLSGGDMGTEGSSGPRCLGPTGCPSSPAGQEGTQAFTLPQHPTTLRRGRALRRPVRPSPRGIISHCAAKPPPLPPPHNSRGQWAFVTGRRDTRGRQPRPQDLGIRALPAPPPAGWGPGVRARRELTKR